MASTQSQRSQNATMTALDLASALTGASLAADTGDEAIHPTHGEIARLAYEFFEARGGQHGHDVADWLAAERRLRSHYR